MHIEIEFTWGRAKDGRDYEVSGGTAPGQSVLDGEPSRIVIKPGAPTDPYQPRPDLWTEFARIRTEKKAERFVRLYGLTRHKVDALELIIAQAEHMRGDRPVAIKLNAQIVEGRLKVSPATLLDALWLQYAKAKSEGRANWCPMCKRPFETGPDTRRRKGARFCSRKCDVRFHSLKRSRPQS